METANAASAQSSYVVLTQDIKITEADKANGTMTIGGISVNPSDGLVLVSIARSGVTHTIAFNRLDEAQKFVDNMRVAREILQTITFQKELIDESGGNVYGPNDRITLTESQARFLSDQVGEPTPVEDVTVWVENNSMDRLPPDLVKATGLEFTADGRFIFPEEWYAPARWHVGIQGGKKLPDQRTITNSADWPKWDESHPHWQSGPGVLGSPPDPRTIGPHINTSEGQTRQQNGDGKEVPWGRGVTKTGMEVNRDYNKRNWTFVVNVEMPGAQIHKDNLERLEENLKHFIEQMGNDNSLHMSKTKNVLSQGNNSVEAANSIMNANKEKHDKVITSTR
ncbi:MAG: hypothetical protein OXP11_22420 [Gammaproteobacteria bacterium]|nr:hypothetical protein [Gammaproteobacteria bacterium]